MIFNTILLSLREIRRNLLRSVLTMLGIVIGVSAVITMVTLGNGATESVAKQVASLGSNLLILRPGQRGGMGAGGGGAAPFHQDDVDAVANQIRGVAGVAPTVNKGVTAIYGAKNWSTAVTGSSGDYFRVANWTLASGRSFSEGELRAGKSVCVIGDRVRSELFGSARPVGATLRVKNFSCAIVGLLAAKGQSAMGSDQDDVIVMPLRTVQRRIAGNSDVAAILVSARSDMSTEVVQGQLEQLMRERRKIGPDENDDFSVLDTRQIADTLASTTRVMTALLGAVAAVSLLVGGIGIMNIMLVSVTERTREIGIRLAIGALEREVLMQFLIEAMVLSAFGGVIGIVLALGASIGLSRLLELPFSFDLQINLLAFSFSAGIGVVFGFFPARRAARLDPIEALRHG